jgi:hypothetical protein
MPTAGTGIIGYSGIAPDEVARRKKFAESLLAQGMDSSPVHHPLAAVARALQGAMGGYMQYSADEEAKAEQAKAFQGMMGALGAQPQIQPTPPEAAAPPIPPTQQPRGIRNNNPGNIENGPFAQRMPGYAGTDGRFAKFATPENGMTAMDSLLASYGARGINNVSGVINRWAPPSDNNPTSNYAATVAKGMGVDPNAQIDLNDPNVRRQLAGGISQFENGRPVAQNRIQVPQNAPTMPPAAGGLPPNIGGIVQAASNPWLGAGGQAIAGSILKQQLTPRDQWQQYQAPDGTMLQKNATTGEVKAAGTENQAIAETQFARKNWKELGFPDPASDAKDAKDFWQSYSSKRLGGPGVNVSLSTEKKGQEELASKAIGAYTDAQFAARESQKRVAVYDRMEKAAESFKPGATADIRLAGQRWLKDLGITAGENVPEGEVLKMLGQQLAIHAQPKGQGAVSNFERDMFAKSLPGLTQSPEGFRKAVGISRDLEKFDMNVAKIYRDSARQHGGVPNYLDVQDKIAALGSPLSDSQMATLSVASVSGPDVDDLVKKYGK